jgi:hypothetical protein
MEKKKKVSKAVRDLNVKAEIVVVETVSLENGIKEHYNNVEVRPAGNRNEVYPPNGYSKYMERWTAVQDGKLKEPAYGVSQALEHIEELRGSIVKGKYPLANKKFEIVETTIIKTAYKTKKG